MIGMNKKATSGTFVVKWEREDGRTSIEMDKQKDMPREVEEMIADALLRNLAERGELRIHVG